MTGNLFSDAAIPRIFTPSLAGTFSKPRHELFFGFKNKGEGFTNSSFAPVRPFC
jgi:hypothetical protein